MPAGLRRLALHLWENGQYSTGSDEVGSEVIATSDELKEVTYNGQTWQQRPELETYLLMGIDKEARPWPWTAMRRRSGRCPDRAGSG